MAFDANSTRLLIELGVNYVQSGAVASASGDIAKVAAAVTAGVAGITAAAAAVSPRVRQTLVQAAQSLGAGVNQQFQGVAAGFTALWGRVTGGLVNGFTTVRNAFGNLVGQAAQAAGAAPRTAGASTAAAPATPATGLYAVPGRIGAAFAAPGTQGPSIGDTQLWQTAFNGLSGTLQTATSAATRFATYGLTFLIAQFTALTYGATKLVQEFVNVNQQFQGLEITLKSSFKSADIAKALKDELAVVTTTSQIPFEGLAELFRNLSIIPQTKGKLLSQGISGTFDDPGGFAHRMITLAEKMVTFRPDKTIADAVFSLREALGGEFRSLVRRFDIPLSVITQLSGRSSKELKTDGAATIEAIAEVFDKLITTQAIRERERQPDVVMRNIKEQLAGVSFLRIGDAGIYNKIQSELASFLGNVSLLNRRSGEKNADGSPKEDSIVDRNAPRISKALEAMFDNLLNTANKVGEDILSRVGFGKQALPGVSLVERAVQAVSAGVESLGKTLPATLERVYEIFSRILPLLEKMGAKLIEITDNLTKMFAASPALATAGLLFGPSRVGMIASAAGASLPAAVGLGALASPGLIRGAGNMLQNYGGSYAGPSPYGAAGAQAFVSDVKGGGFLRVLGAITVAGALIIGGYTIGQLLAEWWKNKGDDKDRGISGSADKLKTALDRIALKDPQSILGAGAPGNNSPVSTLLNRDLNAQALANAGSMKSNFDIVGKVSSLFDTQVARNGRAAEASLVKANRDLGNVLSPEEIDQVLSGNVGSLQTFLNEIRNRLLFLQGQLRRGTLNLPPLPADPLKVAAFEEAEKKAEEYFGKSAKKGGPLLSPEDAIQTKFAKSIGMGQAIAQEAAGSVQNSSSTAIHEQFAALERELNPLEAFAKQMKVMRENAHEVAMLMGPLEKAIGDSAKDKITAAQSDSAANFQKTSELLDDYLKKAQEAGEVPSQIFTKLGMTLADAQPFFKKIVDDISGGLGIPAETKARLRDIKDTMQATNLTAQLDNLLGIFNGLETLTKSIEKGLYQGAESRNAVKALKDSTANFGPVLATQINGMIDALAATIPKDTDVSRNSKLQGAAAAYRVLSFQQTQIGKWIKGVDSSATSILEAMFPAISALNFTNKVPIFDEEKITEVLKGRSRSIGEKIHTPQPIESFPELPALGGGLSNELGVLPDLGAISATNAARERARTAEVVVQQASEASAEKAERLGAKIKEDMRPTINAIEDMANALENSKNIHDAGPLLTGLQTKFGNAVAKFPGLAQELGTSLEDVFHVVREGNMSVDDLYTRSQAISGVYEKLAARLRELAKDPRLSDQQKDQLIDRARKFDDAKLQADQFVETTDRHNKPLESFLDGITQKLSVAKKNMYDFRQEGMAVAESLSKNLGNAFYDFVTGAKTAKEAMREFAVGFLSDLARIAAQAATKQILGLVISLFGSASGSGAGGGTAGAITAIAGAFAGSSTGYATGGQVEGGSGIYDDVPAMLTGGEYVMNRRAVDALGVHTLDALNSGKVSRFNAGGYVGPSGPSMGASSSTNHNNINITVNSGESTASKSDDSDKKQSELLAQRLRSAVVEVLRDEQRPGGILRAGQKR